MIQETRKDPRAKVLSMTVRYKSATLDEFIEHHSHDISRGGMFIKTPSPFPGGTLLKFEVRIADEQKVVQGVGRVVWKRDASAASPDTPAGMGVKFIKLDDDSKQLIDKLVSKRGGSEGAFDTGERTGDNVPTAPQPAAAGSAPPVENRPIPIRKGTMIGLGAMTPARGTPAPPPATPAPPAPAKTPPPPAGASSDGGFFPKGEPVKQPPPEDQTVMRQAAELLRDALREAGGSLDEIGATGHAPVVEPPPPETGHVVAPKPMMASEAKADSAPPKAISDRPKTESAPTAAKTGSTPPVAAKSASVPPGRSVSGPPASTSSPSRRPLPSDRPAESRSYQRESGGKSGLWMLVAVVALGGGIFFFAQRNKPEPVAPEPSAPAAQAPLATATPTPGPSAAASAAEPAPSAAASATAAPSASAVPETPAEKAAREKAEAAAKKAEAEAAKKAEAEQKKAEAEAKRAADAEAKKAAAEQRKADLEAKRAAAEESLRAARAAAAAHPAVAKPKPTPTAAPAAPTEEAPASPAPTTDTAPEAPAPTEKAPAPEAPAETAAPAPTTKAKAAPSAAPAPTKPAPKTGEDDNPY